MINGLLFQLWGPLQFLVGGAKHDMWMTKPLWGRQAQRRRTAVVPALLRGSAQGRMPPGSQHKDACPLGHAACPLKSPARQASAAVAGNPRLSPCAHPSLLSGLVISRSAPVAGGHGRWAAGRGCSAGSPLSSSGDEAVFHALLSAPTCALLPYCSVASRFTRPHLSLLPAHPSLRQICSPCCARPAACQRAPASCQPSRPPPAAALLQQQMAAGTAPRTVGQQGRRRRRRRWTSDSAAAAPPAAAAAAPRLPRPPKGCASS